MNEYTPTILSELTLDEAHCIEPELRPTIGGMLVTHGHDTFIEPVVAEIRQSDMPNLFPQSTEKDGNILILCLPDSMTDDVGALARSTLGTINMTSLDLMTMGTFITLAGDRHAIEMDAWMLSNIENDGLYVVLICCDRVLIVQHPWDDDLAAGLQCAMISSGINYRPYRIWSDAQIAEAALAVDLPENGGRHAWRPQVLCKAR